MPVPKTIKGWQPQVKDFRDYNLQDPQFAPKMLLLPQVVYNSCPPTLNQLHEGSCVFHGSTSAMEAVEIARGKTLNMFSRQFGYYNYRAKYGDINRDDGAIIRLALKQMAKEGICLETKWPYSEATFAVKPSEAAYTDAPSHKITQYIGITGRLGDPNSLLHDLLSCLASGWGFVCGIPCYSSIVSDEVARTGFVPLPVSGEEFMGGHCIYIWGYDRSKEIFWGLNSWGNDWGCQAPTCSERGQFSIPFDYIVHLASDFWTIRMITDVQGQPALGADDSKLAA